MIPAEINLFRMLKQLTALQSKEAAANMGLALLEGWLREASLSVPVTPIKPFSVGGAVNLSEARYIERPVCV